MSKSLLILDVAAMLAEAIWNTSDHVSLCIMTANTAQAVHPPALCKGPMSNRLPMIGVACKDCCTCSMAVYMLWMTCVSIFAPLVQL